MKKIRLEKGITLIALIITIVVLMILAVVTINSVKDGGIITHAQNAVDRYEIAKQNEEEFLDSYISEIEKNIDGFVPEKLTRYILGEDGNGRCVYDIINEDGTAFIDDPTTEEDETQTIGLEILSWTVDETSIKGLIYVKYDNVAYRITYLEKDPDSIYNTEKVEKIYVPKGNEGKTVKYDSNGDGEKEEWTVITDRGGKLEIVSNKTMGSLTLGQSDTNVSVTKDLDGDGTTGDTGDIAIASYNNAISTINNYCKTQVTVTNNVRSVGASKDMSGSYSSTTFDSWSTKLTEKIKAGDTYFEQDIVKMSYWGVSASDNSYWVASRSVSEGSYIAFEVRWVQSDTGLVPELLWKLQNRSIVGGFTTDPYGVRPVVINPSNIEYVD